MHPTSKLSPWTLGELEAYHAILAGKPSRRPEHFHCPSGGSETELPFEPFNPKTATYGCNPVAPDNRGSGSVANRYSWLWAWLLVSAGWLVLAAVIRAVTR